MGFKSFQPVLAPANGRSYRAIYEIRGGAVEFVSVEEVGKHLC